MTQSRAISQSFRVFITFRSMRDTTFFHFSKLIFCTKYRFFYHGDQKMSWWCRWRAVNFEIHLWSSGMNADCIWRLISIQHVQIVAGLNSDPGNDSFSVEIRDAKHVDRSILTSRCRSTQVKLYTGLIASIDLWPQEMFTFSEMLALVQSESSFGAYVCHRRPAGLHSDQRSCQYQKKTIGNRLRDCAWGCLRWKTLPEKHADRKAQIRKGFIPLSRLVCSLRSHIFQVVFFTSSNLTHNLFFYYPGQKKNGHLDYA